MSVKIIQERLDSYNCESLQEEEHAIREITQEVALGSLSRTNFFTVAAFHGGSCLRIFHNLNRFSEDLDFMLKAPDHSFSFETYLNNLSLEFTSFGYQLDIIDRSKLTDTVKKAFIKDDSLGKILQLSQIVPNRPSRKIKIKLEVDTNPPAGSVFENKYLDFPFLFSATAQDLPSLFAGKIHALLCRNYIKGRDWYDFLWYTSRMTPINFKFLSSALYQVGPWKGKEIDVNYSWSVQNLQERIQSLNWDATKSDIIRFIKPSEMTSIELWNKDLFLDRLNNYANKM